MIVITLHICTNKNDLYNRKKYVLAPWRAMASNTKRPQGMARPVLLLACVAAVALAQDAPQQIRLAFGMDHAFHTCYCF